MNRGVLGSVVGRGDFLWSYFLGKVRGGHTRGVSAFSPFFSFS